MTRSRSVPGFTWSIRRPNILFFHGNGEIVSDYDDIAGLSTPGSRSTARGLPRLWFIRRSADGHGHMMRDACHLRLRPPVAGGNRHTGPLIVMGRSLGAPSALELAARYPDDIDGLIVESGFAYALPLLRLRRRHRQTGDHRVGGFRQHHENGRYPGPTLVIHAEFDHIIPFTDGRPFAASPIRRNGFYIPNANHNDIFLHGIGPYLDAVRRLASRCMRSETLTGRSVFKASSFVLTKRSIAIMTPSLR